MERAERLDANFAGRDAEWVGRRFHKKGKRKLYSIYDIHENNMKEEASPRGGLSRYVFGRWITIYGLMDYIT
jgi:hypothetical protein